VINVVSFGRFTRLSNSTGDLFSADGALGPDRGLLPREE
jgi:hypothetical protein